MGISKKRLIKMVQESKNRKAFSDFIAIGDSDLYDYAVTRRAVLMMIAFMQQQDEDKKTPEGSPFDGDYVGWCWASQKFIACRVGTTEDYVHECVKVFEKDGVLEIREWTDGMGYPHSEYRIKREFVDSHQRPEGFIKQERKQPRRGGNKAPNRGSFKPGNKAASKKSHPSPQPLPTEFSAVANRVCSRMPSESAAVLPAESTAVFDTAVSPSKGVEPLGCTSLRSDIGCSDLRSHLGGVITGRDTASAPPPAAVETSEIDVVALFDQEEQKQKQLEVKSVGRVTKGQRVLLNKHTYPDLYEEWKASGSRKLRKCKRCDATLQWNEPAHVCPGYVPKLPIADMDEHRERAEAQRQEMWDNKRSASKPVACCDDCGEEFYSEEEACVHGAECSAREERLRYCDVCSGEIGVPDGCDCGA